MDCRGVEELLPWMLNSTLSPAEQAAVGEHLAGCVSCRLAQAETAFVGDAIRQHIAAEDIVALAYEQSIAVMSSAELKEHLAGCPQCSEELELLRASRRLEAEGEEAEKGNAPVLRLPLASKTTAFSPTAANGQVLPFVAARSSGQTAGWRYVGLAAGLALMLAGGVWLYGLWRAEPTQQAQQPAAEVALRERLASLEAELQREQQKGTEREQARGQEIERLRNEVKDAQARLAELAARPNDQMAGSSRRPSAPATQPQANVLALDIFPLGLTTRAGAVTPNQLEIPADVNAVTLILNTTKAADYPRYAIELGRSDGRILWRGQLVKNSAVSDFTINLPARMLKSGDYLIHIYGMQAGVQTKIETYQIQVK